MNKKPQDCLLWCSFLLVYTLMVYGVQCRLVNLNPGIAKDGFFAVLTAFACVSIWAGFTAYFRSMKHLKLLLLSVLAVPFTVVVVTVLIVGRFNIPWLLEAGTIRQMVYATIGTVPLYSVVVLTIATGYFVWKTYTESTYP